MTPMQAIDIFWNGFGLLAFDENSVPEMIDNGQGVLVKLEPPYITYEAPQDDLGHPVVASASVWTRSSSWGDVTDKVHEIAEYITRGGRMVKFTNGAVWIQKASPWAQRLSDESDEMIRRINMNLSYEFLN